MKSKYGIKKTCLHCSKEFTSRPRMIEYCSTPCKNPINRPGHKAWNKGIKLTEDQKSKLDMTGLNLGRGWNKGIPNLQQHIKWTGPGNPNWDGKLNNLRPKKIIDDDFLIYKSECKKATHRTLYKMKKEGEVPRTGKKKTDMQLDHIIPYAQGYELGIQPYVIGSKHNLRFILGEENREKWDKFQSEETVNTIIRNYNNGLFRKSLGSL